MKLTKSSLLGLVCVVLLLGCTHNPDIPKMPTNGEISASAAVTETQTPSPSPSLTPTQTATLIPATNTPTITSTPGPLPTFTSKALRPWVEAVSYIDSTCAYLRMRWDEEKSQPGTVVVPIMFHSIAKPGRQITDNTTISTEDFEAFIAHAVDLGYETITTEELMAFLESNAKIPARSMIMILDDRRPGVTELFMPFLEQNDWTLTLGWISAKNDEDLWDRMEDLNASGLLDIQSHGYNHIYIQPYTTEEEIREEIYKPINLLEAHFGQRPSAIIWPGGNFNQLAVDIAHEAGLALGFSAFSRGPLMFNWIPLGEEERQIDDPLMVLPRFWSTTAWLALDRGLSVSEEASAAAEVVKEEELRWLELYCNQ